MLARFRDDSAFLARETVIRRSVTDLSGNSTARNHVLKMPDGSSVAWAEYGHPHGAPLVYFHSQGGSRYEARLLHDAARDAGFRLIAIDRPGIGLSSYRRLSGHSAFAVIVRAVLAELGLEQAGLLAWAGGAPFALAFACEYPDAVKAVNLLSPLPARPAAETLSARLALAIMRGLICLRHKLPDGRTDQYWKRLRDTLCYVDRKQFDNPRISGILREDAGEAVRQGSRGVAQDCAMSFRGWDFRPETIFVPVHLWQGSADNFSVPCSAERLQALLPGAILHSIARQGHLFFTSSADDIFRCYRQSLTPGITRYVACS